MKVLPALPAEQEPDLVLLDIKMPGMSGIQSCDELRRLFPTLIIAMHTARPAQECFEKARQAGADAYFVKGLAMELLVGSMHQLQRREGECVCIAPKISGSVSLDASKRAVLSPENERVMRLLSHGSGIKQIAEQLALHEQTVKWHLAEIRRKLRAGSNPDAVRIWVDGP